MKKTTKKTATKANKKTPKKAETKKTTVKKSTGNKVLDVILQNIADAKPAVSKINSSPIPYPLPGIKVMDSFLVMISE